MYLIFPIWAKDSKKVMKAKAKAITAAYAFPPDFFEVRLLPETPGTGDRPPADGRLPPARCHRVSAPWGHGTHSTAGVGVGHPPRDEPGRRPPDDLLHRP